MTENPPQHPFTFTCLSVYLVQWCQIENQQSPVYVANFQDILMDVESVATTLPS